MKSIIQSSRNLSNRFHDRLYQAFYGQIPRPTILKAKELFGDKPLTGAEIGVYLADNSLSILNTLNIDKLYLIDPFIEYSPYNYHKENYTICKNKLKRHSNTEFINKYSKDAINDIPMLDFCYIDGDHHYEHVKEDIELYWNKIKRGGVMGGHDIISGGWEGFGVIQAVTEFAVENKLELYIEPPDWFIIKRYK